MSLLFRIIEVGCSVAKSPDLELGFGAGSPVRVVALPHPVATLQERDPLPSTCEDLRGEVVAREDVGSRRGSRGRKRR